MKYIFTIVFYLLIGFVFAQGWNEDNAADNAKKAGGVIMSLAKTGLTICALVGTGISGYKVFAEGNHTWQYIASFCISVVVLAVAIAFATDITK